MVNASIKLSENNNEIVNLVKIKKKLKDKTEAINYIISGFDIDNLFDIDPETEQKIAEHAVDLMENHRDEFVDLDEI